MLLRSNVSKDSTRTLTGKWLPQVVSRELPRSPHPFVRWEDKKHFLWETSTLDDLKAGDFRCGVTGKDQKAVALNHRIIES